jgi:hypothetical protein
VGVLFGMVEEYIAPASERGVGTLGSHSDISRGTRRIRSFCLLDLCDRRGRKEQKAFQNHKASKQHSFIDPIIFREATAAYSFVILIEKRSPSL